METKLFYFLAILGVAYGLHIPSGESSKSKRELDLQAQLSVSLQSSDHTTLLDMGPFGNAKEILSHADFTNITSIEKISGLQDLNLLPPLPDFRSSIEHARSRVAAVVGTAEDNLETAIQQATLKAIHSANVVASMAEIVYTILSTYYDLAVHAAFGIATIPILQEGMLVAASSVNVVVIGVAVV